jgi:hypothetical protein
MPAGLQSSVLYTFGCADNIFFNALSVALYTLAIFINHKPSLVSGLILPVTVMKSSDFYYKLKTRGLTSPRV